MNNTPIKIGIVISGGSGKMLADIFEDFIDSFLSSIFKTEGKVICYRSDIVFSSHGSLRKETEGDEERMRTLSIEEANELTNLYKKWNKEGVEVVFRTSVNAEALYRFRVQNAAIKEILVAKQHFLNPIEAKDKLSVLLIRDQTQGFYANDDYEIIRNKEGKPIRIDGKLHFSIEKTEKIVSFAKERAASQLGKERGYEIWAVYKHHLFGNIIEKWMQAIDPSIKILQPDTALTELFSYLRDENKTKDLLFIAGNEIGDLMYEPLIEVSKNTGDKLSLYSKSFMLNLPNKSGEGYLCEFQTVHGSADDLIDNDKEKDILPYATLRIASAIIEDKFGVKEFRHLMDKAIAKVQLQRLLGDIDPTCSATLAAIKKELETLTEEKKVFPK